jgi:hypothetical protein
MDNRSDTKNDINTVQDYDNQWTKIKSIQQKRRQVLQWTTLVGDLLWFVLENCSSKDD